MDSQKKGVTIGLLGGVFWGLDTVLIGVIVAMSPLRAYSFLAPLVAAFLHDSIASIWTLLYNIVTKQIHTVKEVLLSKKGIFVVLGGILGGPIGMTSYVLAIHFIGSSDTAIISAMYPAIGTVLGVVFLSEKISKYGILGLILIIGSTVILSVSSSAPPENLAVGLFFAIVCAFAWGSESVALAHGLDSAALPEIALQIRQFLSFLIYGLIVIPLIGGYGLVVETFKSPVIWLIVVTAAVGSSALVFYYRSIENIGAIQSMGLNISYSAWAIFIGLFFNQPAGFREVALAFVIIAGSILTTEKPSDFLKVFSFKKTKQTEHIPKEVE
ncbi:MAG: DMT family transporter [Micrococcaceae bacterium]